MASLRLRDLCLRLDVDDDLLQKVRFYRPFGAVIFFLKRRGVNSFVLRIPFCSFDPLLVHYIYINPSNSVPMMSFQQTFVMTYLNL